VVANDAAGWFSLARSYAAMTEDAFRNVYADNPSSERRYYLDPTLDGYLAGLTTPYQTPPEGFPVAGFPVGALRVLLVSSSRGTLNPPAPGDAVLPFAFGANLRAADQDALRNWNKTFTGGVAAVPILPTTPFGANWNGLGEFLHVQTTDLRPLFCKITLIEYPIPGSVTSTDAGVGYPASTANNFGTIPAGFTFSFTSDATGNIPAEAPGSFFSGTKTMIVRTTGGTTQIGAIIGGSSAGFSATLLSASPPPPWWDISPPLTVDGQQMPTDANTQSFYVIKGTTLSLYVDGSAIPATPVLTVQVNSDSTFEYFNGSWTRVD